MEYGAELWKTDGTEIGTFMIKDIHPTPMYPSNPFAFRLFRNKMYFSADDGIHGRELWQSDGTEADTTMVSDIVTGASRSHPFE